MPHASTGAGPSPELGSSSRRTLRVALGAAIGVGIAALGIAQLQLLISRYVPLYPGLAVYTAAQAALVGLVVAVARLERRPLREYGFVLRGPVLPTLLFSTLLVLAYVVVEIYPGFLVGFGHVPALSVAAFGFTLVSAPVVALGQEAVFRGYIFRTLSRAVPLASAMAISAALFAAQTTNFLVLSSLGEVAGGEYLFGTTVANLVLGLILALQFYKTRWSLLGPVATRTGILWATGLVPVAANFANWETAFAALLLAYGVLFALVAGGLREPRLQAQRYLGEQIGARRLRFRERARSRREVRHGVVMVGAMAVVLVGATQVAPAALGASPPMLAIASGSMVPTLERGTLVVLERAPPSAIRVGTIVAFHVSCLPAPTVHRVTRILQNGSSPVYQTKGDANPAPDPCPVPYGDVIGKVVAIVPFLGLLVLDPLFAGAAIVLILLAALLWPRRDRWRSP
jgi:signal peptidase I